MTFPKADFDRIEATLAAYLREQCPPEHIRGQLDYGYTISGRSVELQEIRPRWNDPTRKIVRPYAKATFVKTRGVWRVYWMRADLKWHSYDPSPIVTTLEEFLALVTRDEHACFRG